LEDVKSRINKVNGLFVQLYAIWKNKNISRRIKIRLFKTNVISVFLYGSETRKVTETVTINCRCLRRILEIWWYDRISNKDLVKETDHSLSIYKSENANGNK
jgi:hypothetical protein